MEVENKEYSVLIMFLEELLKKGTTKSHLSPVQEKSKKRY